MRQLCMIFEATGPYNAIGKIAMAQVETALAAGWQVSVVAKRLHESLHDRVEWLKLYVPPRGFALQWLTARYFIREALGDARRFDVIHGHQPQIADLCNIFQCHFLTRVAYERGSLLDQTDWRRVPESVQKRLVMRAEDYFYKNWNSQTRILFNSELTRREFARLYGLPPKQQILICPSPPWNPASQEERREARCRLFGGKENRIVAGFLGGLHRRKGYARLVASLTGAKDIVLLMAGPYSETFDPPELFGHFKSIGLCRDTDAFYAACDVLIVPSIFEPFGYVASEATARGTPVVATREVGALPHIEECDAGLQWDAQSSSDTLAPIVRRLVEQRDRFASGCVRFTERYGVAEHARQLLSMYDTIAAGKVTTTRTVGILADCA